MRTPPPSLLATVLVGVTLAGGGSCQPSSPYLEDVTFALERLEKECGHFFRQKQIDWQQVTRQFLAEVQEVRSTQDHLVLLTRLLARLKDGHARVLPGERAGDVAWPTEGPHAFPPEATGPGMFWCRSGRQLLVRAAWDGAEQVGITPGMEILRIDGQPALRWLEERLRTLADLHSFSTPQMALYHACHWGLLDRPGARLKLELRTVQRKKKKATVTYTKASAVPWGPPVFPEGLETIGRQRYGILPGGLGYIHLRDIPEEMLSQMDTMLASLGQVPGLILDFRANGGGGCDHDALFGRFIPPGKPFERAHAYPLESAGPDPYGGPIVVIVDAGVRSAGETASGMFKEDGRAYMIGESPTAGMSSSKITIELPSGLFALRVSVRSNKARFNDGAGIEGVGVQPHEIIPYGAKDLASGRDTLLERARALLHRFPARAVPYDPEDFGWSPDRTR